MKKLILLIAVMVLSFAVSLDAEAISPCQQPTTSGCVDADDLDVNTVDSANIVDGSVTSTDIADGTITGTDISDGSVGSADITDGSVTGTDLATGTVTSGNIADGTVTGTDISDGSVGSADITDGSVTGTDLATGTVTSGNIVDGTITGTDILDGSIDTADIAAGAITDSEITGPISASKIAGLGGSPNVITVDVSGNGDFTTIGAAMASITPSASNPYLIEVMPGEYIESLIDVKSYVHIKGSGRGITSIDGTGSDFYKGAFNIAGKVNVRLEGMKIKRSGSPTEGVVRITGAVNNIEIIDNLIQNFNGKSLLVKSISGGEVNVRGNIFERNEIQLSVFGQYLGADSKLYIVNNFFPSPAGGSSVIYVRNTTFTNAQTYIMNNIIQYGSGTCIEAHKVNSIIMGNVMNGCGYAGIAIGYSSSATANVRYKVMSNTIKSSQNGIFVYGFEVGSAIIKDNVIEGSSIYGFWANSDAIHGSKDVEFSNNVVRGSGTSDIKIDISPTSTPKINHNVFDTINPTVTTLQGASPSYGRGNYNTDSLGNPLGNW